MGEVLAAEQLICSQRPACLGIEGWVNFPGSPMFSQVRLCVQPGDPWVQMSLQQWLQQGCQTPVHAGWRVLLILWLAGFLLLGIFFISDICQALQE